ncbi:MAG: hypothetical protein IPO32_12640 [Crocinitomicaceae bacterium]|nr:hypothetical protein [Crocinitomicaceae bacterium]
MHSAVLVNLSLCDEGGVGGWGGLWLPVRGGCGGGLGGVPNPGGGLGAIKN